MRRPARLERAGALTPRDRIWSAIRSFGLHEEFSIAEIMVLTAHQVDGRTEWVQAATVLPYIEGLANAKPPYVYQTGIAQRPAMRPVRECRRFRLLRDVGAHAPNVRRDGKPALEAAGQLQMWNAARKHKGPFDWRAIALCCPGTPMGTVKCYLKFLSRAGYLRTVNEGRGGKPSVFEFIRARDTGPRAPLVSADKSVMDGNTGDIVLNPKEASHAR